MAKTRKELVNIILENKNEDETIEEEEMLHLLLQRKISKNVNSMQGENFTTGEKMADNIAKFAGSWKFIIIFIACLILWIMINSIALLGHFDAYPFILLNLILSCVAAIQAPVIMMSQNRQEEKDRLRSQNDYKVNLKSEILVEDMHQKLDKLIANQEKIFKKIEMMEKQNANR